MTGTIDFTNCKKILGRAYNGANGKKIAVEYNGREYMLKFPPSGATKPTELSYTNSCISEHIASSIFNMVGIKAQETLLGTYEVSGKVKVVCACRDFTEKKYHSGFRIRRKRNRTGRHYGYHRKTAVCGTVPFDAALL